MILDADEIREAVEIHRRCYGLIRWVAEAIRSRTLSLEVAHDQESAAECAEAWIREKFPLLPSRFGPLSEEPEAMSRFARYFGSYLTTSFEFVLDPSPVVEVRASHCLCPICAQFTPGSHLRPLKLKSADKRAATRLEEDTLALFLDGMGRSDLRTRHSIEALRDRVAETHEKALCWCAYGRELLARCRGEGAGPAGLVLWRRIAWTKEGSPNPEFEFSAEGTLQAQDEVVECLRSWGQS